jgi:hypothetical protein
MRELNGGVDSEDDNEVLSQLENDEDMQASEEGEDLEEMEREGSDFFSGEEDLQDVKVEGDEEEEQFSDEDDSFDEKTGQAKLKPSTALDDSEEELGDEDDEPEYGLEDEYDPEEDEEDNIICNIFQKSKKGDKKKKKTEKSIFASYDEFAHLLEGDQNIGEGKKKHKFGGGPKVAQHKRGKRDFKSRSGPQKGKSGPNKRRK